MVEEEENGKSGREESTLPHAAAIRINKLQPFTRIWQKFYGPLLTAQEAFRNLHKSGPQFHSDSL